MPKTSRRRAPAARLFQFCTQLHLNELTGLRAATRFFRHEERRLALEEMATELQNRFIAAIPELYKQEFEQKYVFGRFNGPGLSVKNRTVCVIYS